EDLNDARKIKDLLMDRALSWKDFLAKLKEPINIKGWLEDPDQILKLPPPLGPSSHEANTMFEKVKGSLPNANGWIGVLGLTSLLIEEAKKVAQERHAHVEVVDYRPYKPRQADDIVRYTDKN